MATVWHRYVNNSHFNLESANQFFSLAFRYNAQLVKVIGICIDYQALEQL